MTKAKLINIVAKRSHLTRKASKEAIEVLVDEMRKALKKGEKVVLSGFGTFYTHKVSDKQVVPFGKEDKRQIIKGHHVVNFRVGKPFKKMVW